VSLLFKVKTTATCELCGSQIFGAFYTCAVCGRKVCSNCTRVLTTLKQMMYYVVGGTVPVVYSTAIPGDDTDLYLCKECSDLFKITLRVAVGKDMQKVENNEY